MTMPIDPATYTLDWMSKPHEEWPSHVKEYHRLLCVGQERFNAAKALDESRRYDQGK
jgi:hypothetical protein